MTAREKLDDIKKNPNNHMHTFDELTLCCMVDGAFDCMLMEAHSDIGIGDNGGVRCDVVKGPCACGAWH